MDSEQWVPECKGKKYDDKIKQTFDKIYNEIIRGRCYTMDKRIQWHPGFCSAIRLIFKDYWSVLEFEDEYQLTDKPMQIDCVVIKKVKDVVIDNELGKFFKTYNIFEYKSPEDAMNIDTFYKAMGYACIYKLSARHVDEIPADQITLTLLRSNKPVGLFKKIVEAGFKYSSDNNGIYRIYGNTLFDIQIVVTSELNKEEYLQLKAMTKGISKELFEEYLLDFEKKRGTERILADVVLEVITRGNESMIEKWKESDKIMCETMIKIMANELEESKRKGIEHGEHLLADTIIKLRSGDSREKLLEEGIAEETINLALTLL